ncbi:paramyosin [Salpingoeca rosetta]|uniref:Paramyosin n=1 Tax=Salpingoeca rosetta (strain ATCC 50818 / BSB-021) TaxID=946362 RepID=F2UI74_SALR5|nr:paramyosin [Salpingoeca rosetta]EGD76823.1 paramyosin [Salpingoeca rosetta]|eukprot:XP_004991195.1 paramyosin [Salpingoeca rosetta]
MADWIRLQRKIFTRWVNQRLQKRHLPPLNDVVEDLGKGKNLVQLVESLAERTCSAKLHDNPRFKAQEIENLNHALAFVYECGVSMTLKPSPENLLEGDERAVLGLVWALMMKYLKFAQEDDETLSPKDALLRWVNLNTQGHAHAQATNFTTSFRDGMVLCALIHKFRPDLIDYDSLTPEDPLANLATAMKAAQEYFGLEQYVEPSDIAKLDEKSMLVYVSEYYAGITEQLKLDLAFRRISQLIEFTIVNDKMKAQYEHDAADLRTRIQQAEAMLTSLPEKKDNTMAGARRLLETFDAYRSNEKRAMFSEHIKLEALFTNLATRLADNKRPPFTPSDASLCIDARAKQLASLQDTEQRVGLELHNEVSRQLRLQQQHELHKNRCDKIKQWVVEHNADLPDINSVQSSGQASNLLKFLEASEKEIGVLRESSLAAVQAISAKLEEEGFEFVSEARAREEALDQQLTDFKASLIDRRPAFEDAYKRECFKEEVQRSISVHSDMCEQLTRWGDRKREYLNTKEAINSLEDAERQVSILEAFDAEREDTIATTVAELKRLGTSVRAAAYSSQFSQWKLEDPGSLETKERSIDQMIAGLGELANHKRDLLADDVQREQYAQATRLMANQHDSKAALLRTWVAEKKAYLQQRESCDSVEQAQFLLGVLAAYRQEKENVTTTALASLQQLGKDILAREYKTAHSSYAYESPAEVTQREADLHAAWKELDALAEQRQPFLDDHLARNQFQNKVRLWVKTHADAFKLLSEWHASKRAYLQTRETIESVDEAQLQLGILSAFRQEKKDTTEGSVAALKQLGQQIRDAEYKTQLSQWKYEAPGEVQELEQQVEGTLWPELDAIAKEKQRVLEDDLAREQFKEATRLQVQNHVSGYELLEAWCKEKVQYLETKEKVTNSEEAKVQLSLLNAFEQKKEGMYTTSVKSLRTLGRAIREAKYASELSTWVYERPDDVSGREARVEERWAEMAEKSAKKREVLEDDKARELYAEETRLLAGRHESETKRILEWAATKAHYLAQREECTTISHAEYLLSVYDAYVSAKNSKTQTSLASLKTLGQTIAARKYATPLSKYTYEDMPAVEARETSVDNKWVELDALAARKKPILDDHLARTKYQKKVRMWADTHANSHAALMSWAAEKQRYLETREEIHSVPESKLQLSLLQACRQDMADRQSGAIANLQALGADICAAKYATDHSEWTYEKPADVNAREQEVVSKWEQLNVLAEEKQKVLEDHLAREEYAEQTRLLAGQHHNRVLQLEAWYKPRQQFLDVHCRETVHTVDDALYRLGEYEAYVKEKAALTEASVASLKQLGKDIRERKYETAHSSYVYEDPATLLAEEKRVDEMWAALDAAAVKAKAVLDDNLARNQFQNKVRLWVKTHADMHTEIAEWYLNRKKYLENTEVISSIQSAELQLSVLSAFRQEKKDTTEGSVAALKQLGQQIRDAEYKTQLSQWKYEAPGEVQELEQQVEGTLWPELDAIAKEKQRVLEDDLAREQFKEATRLQVQNHVSGYELLEAWCKEKVQYLETKEKVTNSEEAKVQLSLLDMFDRECADMAAADVAALRTLGRAIREAKYASELSTWVYERPDDVSGREARVEERWAEMAEKSAKKREVLEDDKARELYAEETRLLALQHADQTALLETWVATKARYLQQREEIALSHDARFHLSLADAFVSDRAAMKATSMASLHALRDTIFARKYETALSRYAFESPEEVTAREQQLDTAWEQLDGLLADKKAFLEDRLACTLYKEDTELSANIHRDMHDKIAQWCAEKLKVLKQQPTVSTVQESHLQLSLLDGFLGEQRDKEQGAVALFKERGAAIRRAQYKTAISAWVFGEPEKTSELETHVDTLWQDLAAAEKDKRAYLQDCLARTQYCAKVARVVDQHISLHTRLMGWIGTKQQALQTQPPVDSLADAAVKLRLLEALGNDLTNTRQTTLASLQALGKSACDSKYESELSQWTFPDTQQVHAREQEVDAGLTTLADAIEAKKTKLTADQATEQTKEDLRQEFAHAAHAMRGFVKDNIIFVRGSLDQETTKATTFAFSLDETENMRSELEADAKSLTQQAEQHKATCMQVYSKLSGYGPVSNPYTSLDEAGLNGLQSDLKAALKFRDEQYEKALALQKANDELCREFAAKVNPLMTSLRQSIDAMAKPQGTLTEQLEKIDSELANMTQEREKLVEIEALSHRMKELGIEYNPHSSVTLQDLTSQFDDYHKLLTYKKPLLEREIEFKKSRGVSKAQLEEIESFFKKFDRDGSGSIEKKELKACLFSLGEELTSAEVENHMRTFGSGGRLNLQQFKELMIHLIGVIHTREHILGSFSFIARDEERVGLDKLQRLKQEHLDFVKETVPSAAKDNSLDYQQFTDIVFSR